MKSSLQKLPSEVLHDISEILDYTHPPSLLAFARASKGCYAIASPLLHHTIKITVTDDQHLLSDANKWETILARDRGFTQVRRLIFLSDDESSFSDDGSSQYPYLSLKPCERYDNDD